MAEGGGGAALEAQQRLGIQIPWVEYELGENAAKNFLNAYALGTRINQQALQYEKMMGQLQMENEKIKIQREGLENREEHTAFLEKVATAEQNRRDWTQDMRERALIEQQKRDQDKRDEIERKVQAKNDTDAELDRLNQAFGELDGTPGSAARLAQINKVYDDYRKLINSNKDANRAYKNELSIQSRATKEVTEHDKDLYRDAEAARKQAGNLPWYDYEQPPGVWGDRKADSEYPEGAKFLAHDSKTGAIIPSKDIEKWSKQYKDDVSQGKRKIVYTTIPREDLEHVKTYRGMVAKRLRGDLEHVPGYIKHEFVAEPPADETKREVGQLYQLPGGPKGRKGVYRWQGDAGWQLPDWEPGNPTR